MAPKFSIVTPSFRQLEWLRLAAASVADQAGVEVEHIVQDAGTGPELEQWAAAQPRLKLYVEKDNGMYDAINRGLARTTGEICAYLNCDEQYLPGTLRGVADFFEQYADVDVVFGNVVIVDDDGRYICSREILEPRLYHMWVCTNPLFAAATFFRRRMITEKKLFFDDRWRDVGDTVWFLELLKRGIRMAHLPRFMTTFADTGANMNLRPNAIAESKRLAQSAPLWARALTPFWVLEYRLRRLLAGHYFPRPFEYAIYTPRNVKERQIFCVEKPTGIWCNRL